MVGSSGQDQPLAANGLEESRLRAIINHVADGIVIVDAEGQIQFVNPAAEALLGRPAASLLGDPFGLPLVTEQMVEIDVLGRETPPVVAELRVTEMEWAGAPAYLVSIRDITDRQRAEDRARQLALEQAARSRAEEDERRSRFLAEASRALDSTLDVDRLLESVARLMITPDDELETRGNARGRFPRLADLCIIDLIDRDGRPRRVAVAHHDPEKHALASMLKERFPLVEDWPFLAADVLRTGEPVLHRELPGNTIEGTAADAERAELVWPLGIRSLIVAPLRTRQEILGAIILGCEEEPYEEGDLSFAVEFAARAALAITNARLYDEAQSASRAKTEFLAVMSHELRTPLNAIMGYTDLLLAQVAGPLGELQERYVQRTASASEHLLDLVEEILTYSRIDAGHDHPRVEHVGVATLVNEAADIIRPLAERKRLDFQVDIDALCGDIDTDPAKLRQILLNLLSNAVKFTEEGQIRLSVAPQGTDRYLIRVRDTGCGIPAEHIERIFEPFWQVEQSARRKAGGAGLGLSVAKQLAELLGGNLSGESHEGRGSVFTLDLPIRLPQPTDDGGVDGPKEAEPERQERLQPPGAARWEAEGARRGASLISARGQKVTDRERV